ncbi:MAG: alpha/beta fold hydrolase [Vicinamibacterales bacterium]
MPTLRVNDFDCHYQVRGDGRPLLLLHGGMGIGDDWRYAFATDPPGRQLIVPDLRGHGASNNPSRRFTFAQCAEDMLALLDSLGLAAVDAMGLSMGAKALLHIATRQPARVRAMVLVSAAPYFPMSVRAAMARYTPESLATLAPDALAELRARHPGGDEQLRNLYAMMAGFAESYHDMAFTPPLLATIAARTLIVHGDRDPLYPVELALELYRSIPDAALWVVPHGGHGPIFGALAPEFARVALAHLDEATGRD